MKNINVNDDEIIILKSLLTQEIGYLEKTIKSEEDLEDKNELSKELDICKNLLLKLNR